MSTSHSIKWIGGKADNWSSRGTGNLLMGLIWTEV